MKITKKKIIFSIVIVLAVGLATQAIFGGKPKTIFETVRAKKADLRYEVSVTGKVEPSQNIDLAFEKSGKVRSISAFVGKKVSAYVILAVLDQKEQLAALTQARGALASAQANYDKIIAGASSEDVAVAQATLDAAKAALAITQNQQTVLVANSLKALNNSTIGAIPRISNASSVTLTVSGTFDSSTIGTYKLTAYDTGVGPFVDVTGLETGNFQVNSIGPTKLGQKGLYVQFSSTSVRPGDIWEIEIPNTKASNYVTNYNAYQAALQTQASALSSAQSAVDQAQAALSLKKAQARPADISAASAQILSAQGQVQAAQAALESTIIRAPVSGTITKVDLKIGQIVLAQTPVISLISNNQYEIKAFVPEADIARIAIGNEAKTTLDAYSSDFKFDVKVVEISPVETVIDGVSTYEVTFVFGGQDERVRSGMTANLDILVDEHKDVVVIPQRAVFAKDEGKFIKVLSTDGLTTQDILIKTGLRGSDGNIEVLDGVGEGTEVVVSVKD